MNRRQLLKATTGFAVLGLSMPMTFAAPARSALSDALNATEFGLDPTSSQNQNKAFSAVLAHAAEKDSPVFLPPGRYLLSDIALPKRVRLIGVAGASKLVHGGGVFLQGRGLERLSLSGITLDGAHAPLGNAKALLDISGVRQLLLHDCDIAGSGASAAALEQATGRIEHCRITDAADYGLYCLDAKGLSIEGNNVTDCGNGGILVHRSAPGEDGTSITGNRVARIRADRGGTGQYGNGINAYRADNVRVNGNEIADCAFSAIRGNSAGNFLISDNTCLRSGETALYAEFAFQGAVIANNIVDGAAHGISIANFDRGGRLSTCSGNIVRNLSDKAPYPSPLAGFGVGISVEADAAITGNVIENAPLAGIRIGWGPFMRNVSASGNVIRKTPVGIALSVVEGTGAAVITGNVFEETPRGAIVGFRWKDAVSGDLSLNGGEGFAHVTIANNRTF
ncbi:TIGR03808 family TAT-translocated repetitive protein [Nitratireductor indicus]|uniref:TIGR03808 family TAT-translocated repetitive protein n=1 Tax=Nitratireductor indicus TaxID=721133 RepID=UPI002876E850|nr:TIGR03808 family TAT-translocated repetitive protein [Nitratireductor indicus]MDS1134572.1 TIGR03808 family TAT-translocated repetitive protein [Nitratireductor indicus]